MTTDTPTPAVADSSPAQAPAKTGAAVEAPEKPAHEAAKASAAPKEVPFNVDVLQTCTARFDRRGWDLFLSWRDDLTAIQNNRITVQLQARTAAGAETIQQLLEADDVPAVKREGATISTITTFAALQKVIRHPETLSVVVRNAVGRF